MSSRRITRAALTSLALAALLGVLAPGCGDKQQASPPVDPRLVGLQFTDNELPRLDSSTSARPLVIVMVSHLTGRVCLWPEFTYLTGKNQLFPMPFRRGVTVADYRRIQATFDNSESGGELALPEISFEDIQNNRLPARHAAILSLQDFDLSNSIVCHGTHGSYVQLIEDQADVIIVARSPSEDELKLANDKSIELDVRPIALDAFVFLHHEGNAVTMLTAEQIRNIYRGKTTNWKDLRGADQDIKAFTRNRNSGSQETMVSLVMNGEPTIEGRSMMHTGMAGPYNSLRHAPDGVGYTFYYYNAFISPSDAIKTFAVDGVAPTSETIADGSYPFVTEVYVVTLAGLDPDSNAALLRDWLLTPEGQAVVADSGYVPLP